MSTLDVTTSPPQVQLASSVARYGGGFGGLAVVLILAFLTSQIAGRKGRHTIGWFILGFFFPLISLVVVFLLPSKN